MHYKNIWVKYSTNSSLVTPRPFLYPVTLPTVSLTPLVPKPASPSDYIHKFGRVKTTAKVPAFVGINNIDFEVEGRMGTDEENNTVIEFVASGLLRDAPDREHFFKLVFNEEELYYTSPTLNHTMYFRKNSASSLFAEDRAVNIHTTSYTCKRTGKKRGFLKLTYYSNTNDKRQSDIRHLSLKWTIDE